MSSIKVIEKKYYFLGDAKPYNISYLLDKIGTKTPRRWKTGKVEPVT